MSFVLHVCFYVLLEHDGTWDTSDPCQNVSAFKLCEASRFPDCMLDTWVVSSNSQHIQAGRWPQTNHGKAWLRNRDCNGLQGTARDCKSARHFFLPGFGTDVCVRLPRITSEQVEEIEI